MAEAEEYKIRAYLLGQLTEADAEQVELRLLSEPDFAEEYDIVVNELTDDYIAGKFEGEELKQVEEHFFKSSGRRSKLKFALALKERRSEKIAGKGRTKVWFKPYLAIAAAVVLLAGGGFFLWRMMSTNSELNKGLAALQSAYRNERPLEARISKFNYAPYVTTRGPGADKIDQNELSRAELTLLDALKKSPTPAVHHALGKVYLAKKDFDRAIGQFDEALKDDPNNAQIYSDLGAAWLEKGKIDRDGKESGKGLEELGRSLGNLNRALELDPNLLEAFFNRALCEKRMTLYAQAKDDWQEYLKRDSTSPWAEEARRYLRLLEESRVTTSRQALRDFLEAFQQQDEPKAWQILSQTREMITERMIPLQLARVIAKADANDSDPEALQRALAYAGELELKRSGDPFVLKLAKYYGSRDPKRGPHLKAAQISLSTGYRSLQQSEFGTALSYFQQARSSFQTVNDSYEVSVVDYWIAYCLSREGRISDSNMTLAALEQLSLAQGYKWLLMQTYSWKASNDAVQHDYSKSLMHNKRALKLAKEIEDTYMQEKLLGQIAVEYNDVGNPAEALTYIERGLSLNDLYYTSLRQRWRNYSFAADIFYALKLPSAAIAFGAESLRLAENSLDDPAIKHGSYIHLSRIYASLQDYPKALSLAESSRKITETIAADPGALAMRAFSELNLGHIVRQSGDCNAALNYYDSALQFYASNASTGFIVNYYDSLKGRLLCSLVMKDDAGVQRDLPIVLELFENHRTTILEEQNRNTFFDREQGLYDIAIAYAAGRQESEAAFNYAEASRARSLWDTLHNQATLESNGAVPEIVFSSVAKPLTFAEIRPSLPSQVQLIEYAVLPEKVLIWVVSQTQFSLVEVPIAVAALNEEVHSFLVLLTRGSRDHRSDLAPQAQKLYQLLIGPVESLLDKQKTICLIPDKTLTQLPFAGLVSPEDEYLVSKYTLLYAPSAAVFLVCSQTAQHSTGVNNERLLSLGNPAFDRATFPALEDLPEAVQEARSVADSYQRAECFVDSRANKNAFLRGMKQADVLHFAGHYLVDGRSPLLSRVILAPTNSSDNGVLTVGEIFAHGATRPHLIVLSACRTASDTYYGGEEAIGISQTFLGAGVPLVVSSQWPVDSEATAQLMILFHRYRTQEGLATPAALRKAQLEMISGAADNRFRHPYYWAAFAPLGGYSAF